MAPDDVKTTLNRINPLHMVLAFVLPLPLMYGIAALGFHAGIAITPWHGVGALVLLSALLWRTSINRETGTATILLAVIPFILCGYFWDISYDGPQYHQEAMIQLANGYNPFRDALVPDRWDVSWALWINTLPKFTWICGAVIYKLTGNIELAKVQTLLLMLGLGFYAFHVLHHRFEQGQAAAIMVCVLLALNPVYLVQYLSNYTDAEANIWAMLAVLALTDVWKTRCRMAWMLMLLFASCAALTKITALIMVLPALLVFFVLLAVRRRWRDAVRYGVSLAAAGIIAVIVFGFNPYVTNMARYANPLFPLKTEKLFGLEGSANRMAGDDTFYRLIYTANLPHGFEDMSPPVRLFYSMFGAVQNASGAEADKVELKIPGLITSLKELSSFGNNDVRVAGWGALFSLALVLAFAVLLWCRKSAAAKPVAFIWLFILITLLLHPEGWWARYAPQAWVLPVAAILLPLPKRLYRALLVVVCINLLLVGWVYVGKNIRTTRYIDRLAASEQLALQQGAVSYFEKDIGNWWAHRVRYLHWGIPVLPTRLEMDYVRDQIFPRLNDADKKLLEKLYEPEQATDKQKFAPPLSWAVYDKSKAPAGYIFSGTYLGLKPDAKAEDKAAAARIFTYLAENPAYQRAPVLP